MSGVKMAQVLALVRAHFAGEEQLFKDYCRAVEADAAAKGHRDFAYQLRTAVERGSLAPRMVALPQAAKGLLEQRLPETGLAALVLAAPLRECLDAVVREHQHTAELLAAGFSPARRLLLVGPPGTGKSSSAAALAHDLRLPLVTVRLAALVDSHMGETGKRVREALDAFRSAPVVLLLDEVDAVGRARAGADDGPSREMARVVNTFLQELDASLEAHGVLVATTNLREALDPALVRRFDQVLEFDLPGSAECAAVARARLAKVPGADAVDWAAVGRAAHPASHADVVTVAARAGKAAVLAGHALTTEALVGAFRPWTRTESRP